MANYRNTTIRGKYHKIHRLVMEKRLGRPLNSNKVVHHKDWDKDNNKIENLEVMDKKEHNILSGRLTIPNAKLSKSDIKIIRKMLKGKIHQWLIAYAYGVCRTTICHINTGKTWVWA